MHKRKRASEPLIKSSTKFFENSENNLEKNTSNKNEFGIRIVRNTPNSVTTHLSPFSVKDTTKKKESQFLFTEKEIATKSSQSFFDEFAKKNIPKIASKSRTSLQVNSTNNSLSNFSSSFQENQLRIKKRRHSLLNYNYNKRPKNFSKNVKTNFSTSEQNNYEISKLGNTILNVTVDFDGKKHLNNYMLTETIGSGGYSFVYKAINKKTKKKFVKKKLKNRL